MLLSGEFPGETDNNDIEAGRLCQYDHQTTFMPTSPKWFSWGQEILTRSSVVEYSHLVVRSISRHGDLTGDFQ
jgi:hypothetical protein